MQRNGVWDHGQRVSVVKERIREESTRACPKHRPSLRIVFPSSDGAGATSSLRTLVGLNKTEAIFSSERGKNGSTAAGITAVTSSAAKRLDSMFSGTENMLSNTLLVFGEPPSTVTEFLPGDPVALKPERVLRPNSTPVLRLESSTAFSDRSCENLLLRAASSLHLPAPNAAAISLRPPPRALRSGPPVTYILRESKCDNLVCPANAYCTPQDAVVNCCTSCATSWALVWSPGRISECRISIQSNFVPARRTVKKLTESNSAFQSEIDSLVIFGSKIEKAFRVDPLLKKSTRTRSFPHSPESRTSRWARPRPARRRPSSPSGVRT